MAELTLSPIFASRPTVFSCHMEPMTNYRVYDLEVTILHKDQVVNNNKIRLHHTITANHPENAIQVLVCYVIQMLECQYSNTILLYNPSVSMLRNLSANLLRNPSVSILHYIVVVFYINQVILHNS